MSGVCGNVRPDEAHANRLSVEAVLRIEHAIAIVETASNGGVESMWGASIEPPNGPLPGCWIVRTEGQSAIGAAGQVQQIVVYVRDASHQQLRDGGSLELIPSLAADETIL